MENRVKTIFLDIDGTIIHHYGDIISQYTKKPTLLEGTIEKLIEWDKKGYNIILTTGRRESMRKKTIKELSEIGIFYDQLIMGIGGGVRVLINDKKDGSDECTAIAINLIRNEGVKSIKNL